LAALKFLNPIHSQFETLDGESALRKALKNRAAETYTRYIQISMPRVGLEPTIAAFQQTISILASDCAATVIGSCLISTNLIITELLTVLYYHKAMKKG
jgi:hypothetical protein